MAQHGNNKREIASAQHARMRSIRLAKFLAAVIVVCAVFVAGFWLRGDTALLQRMGFTSLVVASDANPGATVSGDTYDSLSARVAEVEGILNEDSLDSYDLDQATSSVLDSLTNSTSDAYLRYYDSARYAKLTTDASSDYSGIGVLFAEYKGNAYVADVFSGSVAQIADVQQGDFVVAIDGDREHAWSVTEVVKAFSRQEGDEVVITWRRPASLEASDGSEYTTTLTCSTYHVANVTTQLSESTGIISLKQLTQDSSSLVQNAVTDLAAQGATSYVLDLRDNPGGYLTQAVDIASLFVKSGTIVKIQTTAVEDTAKTATGAYLTDKPLVVLVNGNTAAAAEVLAASLQENQRATVVGTKTLGKGSVQVIRELSFGGALRYTAALYKTPLGHYLDGVGVTPNVSVAQSDGDSDSQLTIAVETASALANE